MSGFRPRFFVAGPEPLSSDALGGTELSLSAEDSYHASRVLRLDPGDECEIVVGAAVYAATVCESAETVNVRVGVRLAGAEAGASYQIRVGLVQALGRPSAMEYVLEKGTEVGSNFFWFVGTGGSPGRWDRPRSDRLTRWRRVVREAAKQSKQVLVPEVEVFDSIDVAIEALWEVGALSIVLEPDAVGGLEHVLAEDAKHGVRRSHVALLVGPEGGWSPTELQCFSEARTVSARLGRSVLRTETAGPVAVALARSTLRDW